MTSPHSARSARGFSLVELLISLVISAIVIGGALALLMSQQRSFQTTSADRMLQETARIALGHITTNLRQAGFGVDPALAFDFGPMNNARMARAPTGVTFSTAQFPASCAQPVTCRDSIAGPDEIVFLARDPAFGPHPLLNAAVTGGALTFFTGTVNPQIRTGQILQVICYSDGMNWAYVTANGPSIAPGNGTATVSISSSNSWNFPEQDRFSDACFSTVAGAVAGVVTNLEAAAKVFKVDRFRYFIQVFNGRPYLMLDQGLVDATGTPVTEVIAPDVEDLQFSYVYPATPINQLVGATQGVAIAADDTGINPTPATGCPIYSDAADSPPRMNHHPANIRAVRVSLVVRSAEPDTGTAGTDWIPAAGNRPQIAGAAGYRRLLVETTIAVRNLEANAPYYPTYGTAGEQLNVGGG